jgi:N-acetylglucosamine kinase-like BadF-type ATPase
MLIGIDIGGTKTQLVGADGARPLFDETVPTSSWRGRRDDDADAAALVALATRNLNGRTLDILVVGSHGCDSDKDCAALQARLASLIAGTVVVLNDSELVPPAAGKTGGISVICGTGSIAVTRRPDRGMIAAGGWGWYLGDEGSASGLVREAARAVRTALDQGAALDDCGKSLMNAVAISNPVELGRALSERRSAAEIGALAPLVFAAAQAGSALALRVIEDGGRALAILVQRLAERGALGADIVTGGGVITRQPLLFQAFREALGGLLPDRTLSLLREPPVLGAMTLARELQAGRWPTHLPLPHIAGQPSSDQDWRAA